MKFPRPSNFPYKEVFYSDVEIALIKGHYKDTINELEKPSLKEWSEKAIWDTPVLVGIQCGWLFLINWLFTFWREYSETLKNKENTF